MKLFLANILFKLLRAILDTTIIIIFLWIFVRIKRWYIYKRIDTSKDDFKTVSNYVTVNGKPLSSFQRIVLGQTGEIPTKDKIVQLLLILMTFVVFWAAVFVLRSIIPELILYIVLSVYSCLTISINIDAWNDSLYYLIMRPRLFQFLMFIFYCLTLLLSFFILVIVLISLASFSITHVHLSLYDVYKIFTE